MLPFYGITAMEKRFAKTRFLRYALAPAWQSMAQEKFRITPIEETDESITLQVARSVNETLVVKFTPSTNEVSFTLGAGEQEREKSPEHPEITLEGNPAKAAKYDKEKHTFLLRFAHHLNPQERTVAQFYDVVAEGEKADDFFKLFITDTRMQLHITGWDVSQGARLYKGTQGIIKADSIEKLPPGTRANSEILPGRVRLPEKRANGG
jgi:hypothetical protein